MNGLSLSARLFADKAFAAFQRAAKLIIETLREIFDESSYRRFLVRENLQRSRASYAMFQLETAQTKSQRPRCC